MRVSNFAVDYGLVMIWDLKLRLSLKPSQLVCERPPPCPWDVIGSLRTASWERKPQDAGSGYSNKTSSKCSPASRIVLLPAGWERASAAAGGSWGAERDGGSALTKAGAAKKKGLTPLVTRRERGSAFPGRVSGTGTALWFTGLTLALSLLRSLRRVTAS